MISILETSKIAGIETMMRIKEVNPDPSKNVGLGPLNVNQMQKVDYNSGDCG